MDLNKKLEELKPYQLNCNVFDVYSYNGLSMQDLLCQFFSTINECVTASNEVIDLTKWLVGVGLEEEVVKKLIELIKDGTVEKLINVNLFNTLNVKIDNIDMQLKEFANNQIPEEYLKSSVDMYISENNSGLSTLVDDEFISENIILAYEEGLYKKPLDLEFEKGTIDGAGNNGEGYDYIARLKLKTLFDDNTTLSVAENFRYKLHKYDKNANYWISSGSWLTSPTVINSDFKYRITVSRITPTPDHVLTDKEVYEYSKKVFTLHELNKSYEDTQIEKPVTFNVASWNIAHFGNGNSSNPGGTLENLVKYRNVISDLDANILLVCEDDPFYNEIGNTSLDVLYSIYNYRQQGSKRNYSCNSIYSDFPTSNKKEIDFNTRVQEVYFNHSTVTINNKVVNVIATHLDWYDITIRQSQIKQLINYCKDMEYVIIGADFNTSCRVNGVYPEGVETGNYKEDYKLFTDAGYYCANDGYFGMFGTVNIDLPWDNIIFKNMTMKSVRVIDDNLSDHKPIVAKFLI